MHATRFVRQLATIATAFATAIPAIAQQPAGASADSSLSRALAVDPLVKVGTLGNGIRYFIRENRKPEKRAELRLVINAGSVLEDNDQRGLAHFLEHMAFNGTRRFAKNELVGYLESVGMRFGPDINAYTSFDETVYMLQIPIDTAKVVETAFQILEDWARYQTLDPVEIDKERGVVIEEWRLGQGAESRMRDKQLPVVLHGSRYAERLPIGQKSTLESFKPEVLKRFYTDWYRPDLMAVVAVGDFDKARIERLITDHFSGIAPAQSPRKRETFPVPTHDSALVSVATDKEATNSSVAVYYKLPREEHRTVGEYRQLIIENLFTRMLNQRFFELTRAPNAPFVQASASQGRFLGNRDAFILGALVQDGGIERGLEALLTEAVRVQRFGFTATELTREKQDLVRAIERAYDERDKTPSAQHADEYVTHYLGGDAIPGIAAEFELYKRFLPGIELSDVNRLAREWMTDENRVVTANAPQKEGLQPPAAEKLLAVFGAVSRKEIAAYEDAGATGSLVERAPTPGTIVKTEELKPLGVTRWTLSNGARVILKPTDFKADQILVRAFSPGGTSLLPQTEFAFARGASTLVSQGGVGTFSLVELQKALAGKAVNVQPSIGELSEEMSGSGSPKDVETLFQLMYLYFTAPRADSSAVIAFKQRQRAVLENRSASPEAAFSDTIQVTVTDHHPRTRPVSAALIDSLDLRKSLAFYRDRFGDASDFTFIIVGNFSVDSIRPLVLSYLAALPSLKRKETWKDVGITFPRGMVRREVHKGTEPKSETQLVFSGPFEWQRQNRYTISSLAEVLRMRLRDVLREELGGTYDVSVDAESSRDPRPRYQFWIGYGSAPDRAEQLSRAIFAQIDSLKRTGATPQEIEKVREIQRRADETRLRENGYWLSALAFAEQYGEAATFILERAKLYATLSPAMIRDAARKYLDEANYVTVRLVPEK